MSLNIGEASKKIKNETQVYENFTKIFKKINESEEKTSKLRKECFQNFEDMVKITENDSAILKGLYKTFGKEMKDLENSRKEHLDKIGNVIIPVTEYYPTLLKKNKDNLENVADAKKKTESLRKSNVSGMELKKSQKEEEKKTTNFEMEFMKYEKRRVEDNRFIFLNFIHSELKYHCAALENLSKLFVNTKNKNVLIDLLKFADEYQIKKYDYSKIGIDVNNLKLEEQKGEEEEKEKRSEVYSEHKKTEEGSDDDEDSFDKKRKQSRKSKNSEIGKSGMSEFENNAKSRNIEEDE